MHRASALLLVVCAAALVAAQVETTIPTPYGPMTGLLWDKSREFRGVPFADPTGRWESPASLTPWTTPYDATANKAACVQNPCEGIECPDEIGEDCLWLSIHTPLPETITEPLPVMVWLHGGAFVTGAGSILLYDGTHFANQTNVITVGVNYRLGALGWLSMPEAGIAGNYGLQDQIRALQFVQNAISAFGGDPNQVTLFGQSAGGTSIGVLMSSPAATGLFHKVVAESNPFGLKLRTPQTAVRVASSFLSATPCEAGPDQRSCMLSLTTDEIREAQSATDADIDFGDFLANFYNWTPLVDGQLVLGQPLTLWRAQQIPDIPIIMGHTSEEGVLYAYGVFTSPVSRLEYLLISSLLLPNLPMTTAYPSSECDVIDGVQDCRYLLSRATTDYIWICPMRNMMRGMADGTRNGPLYGYRFAHPWSFDAWGPQPWCDGYVCHAAELPFVWNACFLPERFPPELECTDGEDILGSQMGRAWGQYANTDDPVTPDADFWEQFGTGEGNDNYMVFDTDHPGMINDLETFVCDLHDESGYHPEEEKTLSPYWEETLAKAGWTGPNLMGKPRTMANFRLWLNETFGPF